MYPRWTLYNQLTNRKYVCNFKSKSESVFFFAKKEKENTNFSNNNEINWRYIVLLSIVLLSRWEHLDVTKMVMFFSPLFLPHWKYIGEYEQQTTNYRFKYEIEL